MRSEKEGLEALQNLDGTGYILCLPPQVGQLTLYTH